MGGGGGFHDIGDLDELINRAKKELQRSKEEERKNVFISFAFEDIDYVNLLRAQSKNDKSPIEFNDWSVSEPIDSERALYIKQKIGERIAHSSLTVVFLSDNTHNSDWVKWEIEETLKRGKTVIGVYAGDTCPNEVPEIILKNKIKCIPWKELAETINEI